ncbi:hypothetical protein X474_07505 [Dethiosulfatarculus sandiegensis]|uniref:Uncharacterized protein n=1 Tax=Dethiosulfatarculus sandiegensis TaxID=1429043 RepID=A0A0D2HW53_9BACT|nr:hypothetical protein X474_07505 [Dethiosulfatarculus sandiegensis]
MLVGMSMLVRVCLLPVGMFMLMNMGMLMIMKMFMLVISFHVELLL